MANQPLCSRWQGKHGGFLLLSMFHGLIYFIRMHQCAGRSNYNVSMYIWVCNFFFSFSFHFPAVPEALKGVVHPLTSRRRRRKEIQRPGGVIKSSFKVRFGWKGHQIFDMPQICVIVWILFQVSPSCHIFCHVFSVSLWKQTVYLLDFS